MSHPRRRSAAAAVIFAVFATTACAPATSSAPMSSDSAPTRNSPAASGETGPPVADQRLRLGVGDAEILVRLVDNPTSRDLVSRLPLTVVFEDFANTEMIAYPPEELEIAGSPGSHPEAGDLAVYVPWGNLALFYEDHTAYSDDLGRIVSGSEHIAALDSAPVLIEADE